MKWCHWIRPTLTLGALALALGAVAQVFPGFQGNNQRVGRHDADPRLNNPDRGFLRWWDPLFQLSETIDNWQTAETTLLGTWTAPPDAEIGQPFIDTDPTAVPRRAPYVYAPMTVSRPGGNFWEPQDPAQLRSFTWSFRNLNPGDEFAVSVNLPNGPTDVDATGTLDLRFQGSVYVYRIDGVDNPDDPGQPVYQQVPVFQNGGLVRLGNNGFSTDRVYRVSSGSDRIEVTLLNIIVRNNDGLPVDDPSAGRLAYADAAVISRAVGATGRSYAPPIVGQLATGPHAWRVWGTRNESLTTTSSNTVRNYEFPSLTSFTHNSDLVQPQNDRFGRRGMVWNWPARRPWDLTEAEVARYTNDRIDWLEGTGAYPGPQRFQQGIVVDDLNGEVTRSAGWAVSNNASQHGEGFLSVAAGSGSETVIYAPKLRTGVAYEILVYIPQSAGWAQGVEYLINIGPTSFIATLDQSTANGWVRLRSGALSRFNVPDGLDLSLTVTNRGTGGSVVADAVQFVRTADIAATSTPVFGRIGVRDTGGNLVDRDVVIIALENGRIYCMDARGRVNGSGEFTGDTQVYWTYPSELSNDPNLAAGLDGEDGIAEMPISFGRSAPALARVDLGGGNFRDLLFIGSSNGRVYCIDASGRGDYTATRSGSTERRWSFPDDYPSASVATTGPITGSVTYAVTPQGPTLFVPTVNGRLLALNAVGDNATKTTSTRWQYPGLFALPIGEITMAPVVEFGRLYFGTGASLTGSSSNTFFCLDTDDPDADGTGNVIWSRTDAGGSTFLPFRNSSPVPIPASFMNNGQPDTIAVANDNFEIAALNAANGAVIWRSDELSASPSASLGFSYLRTTNPLGGLVAPPGEPMVMVPTTNGGITAFYAEVGRTNSNGTRSNWQVQTRGQGDVPGIAFGARDTTIPNPRDDDNSWMYSVDEIGYTYAWNFDPDLPDGDQVITPGEPPIPIEPNPIDDNLADLLQDAVTFARVSLVTPQAYEDLSRAARAGTLTAAQITAATRQITRVDYEFGETLYVVAWDLPDPNATVPPFRYTVQAQLNARGVSTQTRTYATTTYTGGTAGRNQALLFNWTLTNLGTNTLLPGRIAMDVRVVSVDRPGANRTINMRVPAQVLPNLNAINVANPLALQTPFSSIGNNTNPADPYNIGNGNFAYTKNASTGELIVTPGSERLVEGFYGPDLANQGDNVAHGQAAVSAASVIDRTLLTLVFGPDRGVQNLRVQLNDLFVQVGGPGVILNRLDPAIYPGLEDVPGAPGNNTSLDYPDIRRDRVSVTKDVNRQVQNPLFENSSLLPPTYTPAEFAAYRTTPAAYNAGLTRQLVSTPFLFSMDTPRFQPAVLNGYRSPQFIYVDANQPGRQFTGNVPLEAYRQLDMGAGISRDERIAISTPAVDLGPLPSGAGYGPLAPWANTAFALDDPAIHDAFRFPFFKRIGVVNEGNTNLLNLRVAKRGQELSQPQFPFVFDGSPNLSPLATLDARMHLHSDLDGRFVSQFMPNNRVVLQKARVTDGEGTRLRINPRRRTNANLEVLDGDFVPQSSFPSPQAYGESIQDPKIGISIPVGMPSGPYSGRVFVFEDRAIGVNSATDVLYPLINDDVVNPGALEPFNDTDLVVRFQVIETRLTNRRSDKSAPMVDALGLPSNQTFLWSSRTPTAARTGSGDLIVAFSSDRVDAAQAPNFNARPKLEADMARRPFSRIYVSGLRQGSVAPVGAGTSLHDLSNFAPANNNRFFAHLVTAFPSVTAASAFGLPASQVDESSAVYRDPSFPAGGSFEMLTANGGTGRPDRGSMWMAFVGEVDRLTGSQGRERQQRLFLAQVNTAGNVTVATQEPLTAPDGSPYEPTGIFGRPSLVQSGQAAVVFYTLGTGSDAQLLMSRWGGSGWTQLNRSTAVPVGLGSAFDGVSSPSATLRPGGVVEIAFTGRARGRTQSELYMARLRVNAGLFPQGNRGNFLAAFDNRTDALTLDPSTNLYWSRGAGWLPSFGGPNGIDILRFDPISRTSISILVPGTQLQASGSSVVSFDSTFGGKVFIDTEAGSVRFSGGIVPRNVRLFVRSSPRFLRLSQRAGFNYRNASMVYDDRWADDASYWIGSGGVGLNLNGAGTNDRFVVGFSRTASQGGTTSRPGIASYRFGVQLPTAIFTDENGRLAAGAFTFSGAGAVQIEPSTGKVFFPATADGQTVTINYRGSEGGRDLGNITVNLVVSVIPEADDAILALNRSANETGLVLALDPQGGGFNNQTGASRRPNLLWSFWTSTRDGASDVYFQTLAPKWGSVLGGSN